MGLFDISIKEKLEKKIDNEEFFNYLKAQISQNKAYETSISKNSMSIEKCHFDTMLKYNTKLDITKDEINVEGELNDTLILAILIILAILLTYGFGVILVVAYTYYCKRKASNFIKEIIEKYISKEN